MRQTSSATRIPVRLAHWEYSSLGWLDRQTTETYALPMELQLPERQSAEISDLAARTGRTPKELVTEAVDRLLSEERWFAERVQIGLDQIARGEFLEEEEMDSRVARMLER